MDLHTFLKIVLRYWWLVLLAMLITTGSTGYSVYLTTPTFEAATLVLVKPSPLLTEPSQVINAQNALERRPLVNTLARSVMTSSMYEQIAKKLNIPVAIVEASNIAAIVLPDTNVIEIRSRSTDPVAAAAIANAAGEELGQQVPQRILEATLIDKALPPLKPISPQPLRTVSLSVIMGLGIGIVFALLNHFFQTSSSQPRIVTATGGGTRDANSQIDQNQALETDGASTKTETASPA